MKNFKVTKIRPTRAMILVFALFLTSCGKEPLEDLTPPTNATTEKNLDNYPDEITRDNWEEFVYAPQELIDYHTTAERAKQRNSRNETTTAPLTTNRRVQLDGFVQSFNGAWVPISGVVVSITGLGCSNNSISIVNPGINYSIDDSCPAPLCMTYNTAANNGLSILDILIIQRHIAGVQVFTEARQFLAADVDRSGTITIGDIAVIQQVIFGMISSFPNSDNVVFVLEGDYQFMQAQIDANTLNPIILSILGRTPSCRSQAALDRRAIKSGDVNGTFAF